MKKAYIIADKAQCCTASSALNYPNTDELFIKQPAKACFCVYHQNALHFECDIPKMGELRFGRCFIENPQFNECGVKVLSFELSNMRNISYSDTFKHDGRELNSTVYVSQKLDCESSRLYRLEFKCHNNAVLLLRGSIIKCCAFDSFCGDPHPNVIKSFNDSGITGCISCCTIVNCDIKRIRGVVIESSFFLENDIADDAFVNCQFNDVFFDKLPRPESLVNCCGSIITPDGRFEIERKRENPTPFFIKSANGKIQETITRYTNYFNSHV